MPASNEAFIKAAFDAGLSEDQVKAAVAERNATKTQPAQDAPADPGPGGLEGVARAVLPRSFKANDEGAGIGRTMLAGAGDALSSVLRVPGALGRMADTKLGLSGDHPQGFTESLNQINQGQGALGQKSFVAGAENDPSIEATAGIPLGAAAKGAGLLGKVGNGALQGLKLGAASAAVHQADNVGQGKAIDPVAAATEVGTSAALGGAIPLVGAGLKQAGKGILNTVIKPGKLGAKRGFEIGNVFDQGVDKGAYTLEGMGQNAEDQIAGHAAEAKGAIQSKMAEPVAEGTSNKINISKLVGDADKEFQDLIKQGKMAGDAPALDGAIKHWEESFNKVADPETGEISLDVANNLKSSLQQDAKKYYEAARTSGAEEPSVKEKVASSLAKKLRALIEEKAPGVKAPNAAMAKLIPVRDAIESRNIIANQNQGLGLGRLAAWGEGFRGLATGHPAEMAIPLAYEVQRSPLAAAKMYRLGQGLQTAGAQRLGALKNPAFATGEEGQQ